MGGLLLNQVTMWGGVDRVRIQVHERNHSIVGGYINKQEDRDQQEGA